jgi:hypothetical protein
VSSDASQGCWAGLAADQPAAEPAQRREGSLAARRGELGAEQVECTEEHVDVAEFPPCVLPAASEGGANAGSWRRWTALIVAAHRRRSARRARSEWPASSLGRPTRLAALYRLLRVLATVGIFAAPLRHRRLAVQGGQARGGDDLQRRHVGLGAQRSPRHHRGVRLDRSDRIVDVGGGTGTLLIAILSAHQHPSGVVFDPDVVAEAPPRSIGQGWLTAARSLAGAI